MRTPIEIEREFAPTHALTEARPFFLVGIGGAGMSALAHMLKRRGAVVRGSDSTHSSTIEGLEGAGIPVKIGHAGEGIDPTDQLVLSDAIDLSDSPEVEMARRLGITIFRRSQLLGWLLRDRSVIAVTGTHGKTTTTSMIGAALRAAGMDPTIVVGAFVPEFRASVVEGSSQWAVVEACEAYDSFHDLNPNLVVLTNLELDHVDFHGTLERLQDSVTEFVSTIPSEGSLFVGDDDGARAIASRFDGHAIFYSAKDVDGFQLAAPGRHNRENAAAAIAVARKLGADLELARKGLESFGGAERRLQSIRSGAIEVVDDYAHHPTEIRASIQALRERYPNRRIVVVFQPHLYSRTAELIPEFAAALSTADSIVLTDIYPAREDPLPGISSARIVELAKAPCRYVPSRHLLPRKVLEWTRQGDVVVGMGAGNISEFAPAFVAELDRPRPLDRSNKLRIVVLSGGDSAEREVSIHSGLAIARALQSRGHQVVIEDVTKLLYEGFLPQEWTGPDRPDLVFLALHGTNAEDGAIQGLLELLHLPYTGSGIQSNAIAMDKSLAKRFLEQNAIRVPKGAVVKPGDWPSKMVELVGLGLSTRCIVKPNAQGSTVGLSFVEQPEALPLAIEKAHAFGDALVEEWVEGMELSVPVLGDRAFLPVEIAPHSGRYDFESKYVPGATEEIVPARISPERLEECQNVALACHRALGCEGATRTDMIDTGSELVVLEVNTLPGMTETSLLPNSARAMGMEMPELCEYMAYDALERYAKRP